tara:strand:+ start:106 stop:273 length:168 start_codon:yes stop_codon:yes gene_type:complete
MISAWWIVLPILAFWLWMARVEPLQEIKPAERLSILEIKLSEDAATRIEYEEEQL